jgi:hypothetical protein
MRDLFGEVIITEDDIHAWVEAVAPAFTSSQRSFALYVRGWNVIEKIRRAKSDDTFDATIANGRARRAALARRFGFRSKT